MIMTKKINFPRDGFFSPESTKSEEIITATRKNKQRRGNDKREEALVGKVCRCGKK